MTFRIVSVVEDGVVQPDCNAIVEQIDLFANLANDKRRLNYSRAGLMLDRHLAYAVLVDPRGGLVTGCGLFNGGRYPTGVYRCMNRTFVSPQYRVLHGNYPAYATRYLLPFQWSRFRHLITTLFVSREGLSTGFLRKWTSVAPDFAVWKVVEDRMVCVVPTSESTSSYQRIAIMNGYWADWAPKTLTSKQWQDLKRVESSKNS